MGYRPTKPLIVPHNEIWIPHGREYLTTTGNSFDTGDMQLDISWTCEYCKSKNNAMKNKCGGCGATKP